MPYDALGSRHQAGGKPIEGRADKLGKIRRLAHVD